MKRKFLWGIGVIAVAAAAFFTLAPSIAENSMNKVLGTDHKISARAEALHKKLFIVDMHSDALMWKRDLLDRNNRGHVDLPRLEDGHIGLQIFSSVSKTPRGLNYEHNNGDSDSITMLSIGQLQPMRTWFSLAERSLYHAQKLEEAAKASNGRLMLVRSKSDLQHLMTERMAGKGVVGGLFSVEGLHDLEGKRANLDRLYDAGMRMGGITHFFDNELGASMHGVSQGGLTPFGREIIGAMEAKGIIVDVAHLSHKGVAEVLSIAKRPVVSSHGGVQATCKVNRNLTDGEVKGIAKTGGVVGIGYFEGAICSTKPEDIAKAILHVRDIAGIDHVALGSDFDGAVETAFDTSDVAHVTQALMDAGMSEADIAKVMGGNMVRVLMQTLPGDRVQ